MNIVIIVQARTGSTRFPGKILKTVLGKPLLLLQLERIAKIETVSQIVVATTTLPEDDVIVDLCDTNGISVFRGHKTDLLDRHYKAGLEFDADVVVKIPSDCPLIDPAIIDKVLQFYIDNLDDYDYVSNLHPATYPDGNDVEVIPMTFLQTAWMHAEKSFELEHTTPYIWDNPERFRIGNVEWEAGLDYSMSHRFTIDYPMDFEFIKTVYEELYPVNPSFNLYDILNLLARNPTIHSINKEYQGVNWYRNHINELKCVGYDQTRFTNV